MLNFIVLILICLIVYQISNKEHLLPADDITVSWIPPTTDNNGYAIGNRKLYYKIGLKMQQKDEEIWSPNFSNRLDADNEWITIDPVDAQSKRTQFVFDNAGNKLGIEPSDDGDSLVGIVWVSFSEDGNNTNIKKEATSSGPGNLQVEVSQGDMPSAVTDVSVSHGQMGTAVTDVSVSDGQTANYNLYDGQFITGLSFMSDELSPTNSLQDASYMCNEKTKCKGFFFNPNTNKYTFMQAFNMNDKRDFEDWKTYVKNAVDG